MTGTSKFFDDCLKAMCIPAESLMVSLLQNYLCQCLNVGILKLKGSLKFNFRTWFYTCGCWVIVVRWRRPRTSTVY